MIQMHGYDKYKRTIADVFLSDGTHVNHMLVENGWCWWCRKYARGNAVLEELDHEACEVRKVCGPILFMCRRGSENGK
jgi:endonuclease YncB( thermonuclease family)